MAIATPPYMDDDLYPTSDGKPVAETDRHFQLMFYIIVTLQIYYQDRPDVYVAGNNFLYWQQGDPKAVVSPDCYVVFGVEKKLRDTYMTWKENGILPAVVFEVTSKKTRREDVHTKRPLYEEVLRVPEYFLFDPTGDYLKPRLQGYRLNGEGRYEALLPTEGRLHSEQLGLDLVQDGETLRLYDPEREEWLLSPAEQAQRRREEAERADAEAERADAAEAELARLRAELAALHQEKS